MSETHFWPGRDDLGVYDLCHHSGAVWKEAMWTGSGWVAKGKMAPPISQTEAIAMGYLGVRREQPADYAAQLKADAVKAKEDAWDWMLVANERGAEIERIRAEVERIKSTDLTALVREAIAEFRREVKQPTKAADWAFKWVGRFIEAVER